MIELKNVSKIYKPSKRVTVQALSNINLSFKEKGFVVLTGESGSGKTTLLNILAGLDTYTHGDMLIDNISTKRLKEKAWDEYRNKRVGIVFQNYSLLEEFSVKKNVSLALELQRINNKREWIDWALDRVNMYEYKNKHVKNLSGGQKQRVAIARAIVKDPQIILADEPTGNLDQTNSEEIFKLLKDLSKEHLVVVITHNVELANKYADRIIRLVDGEIVEDKKLTNEVLEEPKKEKSLPPKGLKMSSILRLGLSSMAKQWFRLIATILILVVMLSAIGVAFGVSRYSKNEVIAKTILNDGNELIAIKKIINNNGGLFNDDDDLYLNNNLYTYIKTVKNEGRFTLTKLQKVADSSGKETVSSIANSPLLMKKNYSFEPYGFVAIEDVQNNGINYDLYAGRWPESNLEICITKYTASVFMSDKKGFQASGKTRQIEIEDLIGAQFKINSSSFTITIVGIVDTKLDEKYYSGNKNNYEELFEELKSIHNMIFATKCFLDNILTYTMPFTLQYPTYGYMGYLTTGAYTIDDVNSFDVYKYDIYKENKVLERDEIIIKKSIAISILNAKEGSNKYSNETNNIDEFIYQEIKNGLSAKFVISKTKNGELNTIETKNLTIVGITDSLYPILPSYYMQFNEERINNNIDTYLINKKEQDVDGIIKLSENYTLTTSKINKINSVSNRANQTKVLGVVLGILFGLLSIIMVVDFTQATIKSNYRHIGILRAMGSTRLSIFKIYILETIILSVVSIIIALFALGPIIQYLDQSSYAQDILGLSLFETNTIDYISMGLIGAILTFTSAFIMIYLSLKKNIIDLINYK